MNFKYVPNLFEAVKRNRTFLSVLELRILGFITMLIFIYLNYNYMFFNIYSVPGKWRVIGVVSVSIITGFAALEYFKPWSAFCLFLLFWPNMWIVRELLVNWSGPHWGGLPELWGGPLAVALSLGCYLRFKKYNVQISKSKYSETIGNKPYRWLLAFRLAMWGLVLSYSISCFIAMWRIHFNLPADWVVWSDWSDGKVYPFLTLLTYVPSLLLGLLLLNHLSEILLNHTLQIEYRNTVNDIVMPHIKMITFALIGGTIAATFFLYQLQTGFTWNFNGGDSHAGSFTNRNPMASFLAIIGVLLFAVAQQKKQQRLLLYLLGCAFLILACSTQSRNAVVMTLSLIMGFSIVRANWKRLTIFFGISILLLIFLLLFPLPKSEAVHIYIMDLSRVIDTIEDFRKRGLTEALGARWYLFEASFLIFRDYPIFGSGPGTFGMLTADGARFGNMGHHLYAAHSMPLNFLAETGLIGMLSWSLAWLILPLLSTMYWHTGNIFALAILVIGLGNLFDTSWMVSGMTTLCVLLIVWACAEDNKNIGRK